MISMHAGDPSACGISPGRGEVLGRCRGLSRELWRGVVKGLKLVGQIFNRERDTPKRQYLRNRSPRAERILWKRLRRRQVAGFKFRRQYGVERYVLDFYCPELKLAIEVDGPSHDSPEAQAYDRHRQQFIESFEIQFLRFPNQLVYEQLEFVVATIRDNVIALSEK
ncbi:MAG: endonuclease domain-containing protein [Cyanobacteria bacterium J06631_9]